MKKFFTLCAVAAMAFAAQANVLTVADGTATNAHYPIYGLYYDVNGTQSQMIYPADMLTDMVGAEITEVRFFASNAFALRSGELQLSMATVDNTEFATATPVDLTEGDIYAYGAPVNGETELVFTLDKPFVYEGGNLLIETIVSTHGNYATTYFYGITTGLNCSYYGYAAFHSWNAYTEAFLPKAAFTYEAGEAPVVPTEKTGAPTFHGYTEDGIHAYFVEILETEPSVIYYRVQYPDGSWTEWAEYEEILSFSGDGKYRVEAYAVADGKLASEQIAYEFVVSPRTGLSELAGDKAIASVRYFNAAGQEMSEINGLTIVVTSYTDGTTSTAKVIK